MSPDPCKPAMHADLVALRAELDARLDAVTVRAANVAETQKRQREELARLKQDLADLREVTAAGANARDKLDIRVAALEQREPETPT